MIKAEAESHHETQKTQIKLKNQVWKLVNIIDRNEYTQNENFT